MTRRWLRCDAGATSIEYGLIAAFIFLAIITGLSATGSSTNGLFAVVGTAFDRYIFASQ